MEGFTLEYSPSLRDEVETTLNTLLPLLHHHYPKANVVDNFHSAVVDKCRSMICDDEIQMIIDTQAPEETEEIQAEEHLLGFVHLKHGFLNRSFLNESFKKCTFFLINLAFCKK